MKMKEEINQQEKNKRLIDREVFCCVSAEVDFILKCQYNADYKDIPFSFDDIENLEKSQEELLDEGYTKQQIEDGDVDLTEHEIYEWWKCSSWLIEKLAEKGECVIKDFNLWGRCCSGQAILLDSVITEIQKETKYGD